MIPVEWPAGPSYPAPSRYEAELDLAQAELEDELTSQTGWIELGERNGVRLSKKINRAGHDGLPIVKGVCLVRGATAEQFVGLVQLVGMRKRWDDRIREGFMLERFDRFNYSFYSCMAGFGWIVSPRDIVGVNRNVPPTQPGGDLLIVQTSVVDRERAPEQPARVRATLGLAGWRFRPVEGGLEVTYLVRTALNGSLPRAIVDKVASEIPLCAGRARDVFYNTGFPPYVRPTATQPEPTCLFHVETFSPPDQPLEYHCKITTRKGVDFELVYDKAKMFAGGVRVSVEGSGVEVADGGAGVITMACTTTGDRVDIVIRST